MCLFGTGTCLIRHKGVKDQLWLGFSSVHGGSNAASHLRSWGIPAAEPDQGTVGSFIAHHQGTAVL